MSIEPALVWMSILGPGCLAMLVLIYVAHKHTDGIEALLINSKYIGNMKITFSGGLDWEGFTDVRHWRRTDVPGPLCPQGASRFERGRAFPVGMKRIIVGGVLILIICFSMMVAFRAWTYLSLQ